MSNKIPESQKGSPGGPDGGGFFAKVASPLRYGLLLGIGLLGAFERWRDAAHALDAGTVAADLEIRLGWLASNADMPDSASVTKFMAGIYPRILAAVQHLAPSIDNPAVVDVYISVAGHFTAIFLTFLLARRYAGYLAFPVAAFFALHPAGRSVAGVISGDATLIAVLLLGMLLAGTAARRSWWILLFPALAVLIRPDGLLAAGGFAAALAADRPGKSRNPGYAAILLAALGLVFLLTRLGPVQPTLGQPAALLVPSPPLHTGSFSIPNAVIAILLTLLAFSGAARLFPGEKKLVNPLLLYIAAGFLFLPHETRWIYPAIPLFFTCASVEIKRIVSASDEAAPLRGRFPGVHPERGRLALSLLMAIPALLLVKFLPSPAFLGGTGLQPFYNGPDKWVLFTGEENPTAYLQDGFIFRNGSFEYIGEQMDINEGGAASIAFPLPAVPDSPAYCTRSTLKLYENGVEIGPAHAPHHLLKAVNDGRFSHWETESSNRLFFSSTDNIRPDSRGKLYSVGDFILSSRTITRLAEPDGRIDAFTCFIGGGAGGGATTIRFSFKDDEGRIARAAGALEAIQEGSIENRKFRKIRIAFTRAGNWTSPGSETITTRAAKEPGFNRSSIRSLTIDTDTDGHAPELTREVVPDHRLAALLAASGSQEAYRRSFPVLSVDQPVFVRVHAGRGWFFVLFLTGITVFASVRERSMNPASGRPRPPETPYHPDETKAESGPPPAGTHSPPAAARAGFSISAVFEAVIYGITALPVVIALLS